MRAYAAELVALKPDLIFVQSNEVLLHVRAETRDIPIVVAVVSDPVGGGFVASLARPGGNITGFANQEPAMGAKWLQLLKQIAPNVQRAAVLRIPNISAHAAFLEAAEGAASSVGVTVEAAPARDPAELERVIGQSVGAEERPDRASQPARAGPARADRGIGGTACGASRVSVSLHGGVGRARVLRDRRGGPVPTLGLVRRSHPQGREGGDLPVQLPTKFELVINLKTAKALGLTVPDRLLVAADEVIE